MAQKLDERVLEKTARRCAERGIVIPTFAQLADPSTIPTAIKQRLARTAMNDLDPANLFRITWKNEPTEQTSVKQIIGLSDGIRATWKNEPAERSGGFNRGNWIEFPSALTGMDSRIIGIVGKYFPTGAHKVGAAFGCLVPRLVSGQFDPTSQKAVWPSTGNYCRGGAFDSALLGCTAVAILPAQMSRERFEWLKAIGAEVITTPGGESNVKEIYDKCWEIRRTRPDCVIFNQFEEFGNAVWHYHVTGSAIDEIFQQVAGPADRLAGYVSATGSAGTIAAGDFLRTRHPALRVVAAEALQCPTLLSCGFGDHRIEGIGDKHIPWIHNVRNTDMVAAVDDQQCISLMRLFNEDAGKATLEKSGVPGQVIAQLANLGISSICNLVAAIKTARYYEMNRRDLLFVPLTDSMELYQSRIAELAHSDGTYDQPRAQRDYARYIQGIGPDHLRELGYKDRKMLHNFKYFTWVEQQGKTADELRQLWDEDFWTETFAQVHHWDQLIEQFNARVHS